MFAAQILWCFSRGAFPFNKGTDHTLQPIVLGTAYDAYDIL